MESGEGLTKLGGEEEGTQEEEAESRTKEVRSHRHGLLMLLMIQYRRLCLSSLTKSKLAVMRARR